MYARKLIIRAENSCSMGKSTAVSAETSRWRSILQSEATVNFKVSEDEEVKIPKLKKVANSSTNKQGICESILIINRVSPDLICLMKFVCTASTQKQ